MPCPTVRKHPMRTLSVLGEACACFLCSSLRSGREAGLSHVSSNSLLGRFTTECFYWSSGFAAHTVFVRDVGPIILEVIDVSVLGRRAVNVRIRVFPSAGHRSTATAPRESKGKRDRVRVLGKRVTGTDEEGEGQEGRHTGIRQKIIHASIESRASFLAYIEYVPLTQHNFNVDSSSDRVSLWASALPTTRRRSSQRAAGGTRQYCLPERPTREAISQTRPLSGTHSCSGKKQEIHFLDYAVQMRSASQNGEGVGI